MISSFLVLFDAFEFIQNFAEDFVVFFASRFQLVSQLLIFLLSFLCFFAKSAPEEGRDRRIFLSYLVTQPFKKNLCRVESAV